MKIEEFIEKLNEVSTLTKVGIGLGFFAAGLLLVAISFSSTNLSVLALIFAAAGTALNIHEFVRGS